MCVCRLCRLTSCMYYSNQILHLPHQSRTLFSTQILHFKMYPVIFITTL